MTKRLLRSIVSGLGVATICCLKLVEPLVAPSHTAVYHWSSSASNLFVPVALDFAAVWFLSSFLLFLAQGDRRRTHILWIAIAVLLPWVAIKNISVLMGWSLDYWMRRGLPAVCIVLLVVLSRRSQAANPVTLMRLRKQTIDIFCIVAISGGVILIQMAWFGWRARGLNVVLPLTKNVRFDTPADFGHPRIIWIVLDELSYQQVYGHRFHTLDLPAFDRLARESTVFTNVAPAGIMTEVVMPSLMTGLSANEIESSSDGSSLILHDPASRQWQRFDQHDTVFSDARNAGYRTAIAGWYNPYCRILPEILDGCFWTFGLPTANDMQPRTGVLENMINPVLLSYTVMNHLPRFGSRRNPVDETVGQAHITDYQLISSAGDHFLKNAALNFVLIHMAVPHPAGIYSRATHTFMMKNSSYLDNLALADIYLAHVRSLLEAEGQWDSSAVVVMGDHSWRTKLFWASRPEWTDEEQKASSGGVFDDRPAYIVKLPGQKAGTTISTPFAAVFTRRLLDEIMSNKIATTADLSAWINAVPLETIQH